MKLFILNTIPLFFVFITLNSCIKLSKFMNSETIDNKDDKPEKIPIINVHMEEPDRDPIEVKRIEEERRIERSRIREMEIMEELDKRTFQQIISMQNSQLNKLSSIADKTSQILNRLTIKDSNRASRYSTSSFKQKEIVPNTYSTIFDQMNGPISLNY